jgi:hypothetical protein
MAFTVTCIKCGSDRFKAGQIELSPEGGYDVVMPCAQCGTPGPVMHDHDPEFAKSLLDFFSSGPREESS